MNKTTELLLANPQVQNEVCGYLAMAGYIEPTTKFSQLKLTEKGKVASKSAISIDKEFIDKLRSMWPEDRRSTPAPVIQQYARYMEEFPDHTTDDILNGAQLYLNSVRDPTYICQLHNYFVKSREGVKIFTSAQFVENYRNGKISDKTDQDAM